MNNLDTTTNSPSTSYEPQTSVILMQGTVYPENNGAWTTTINAKELEKRILLSRINSRRGI